jgi:small-conductance mechanosensitive channel
MADDLLAHAYALRAQAAWIPDWAISVSLLGASVLAALLVHRGVFAALSRMAKRRGLFFRAFVQRTRGPGRFALVILALSAAASLAPLSVPGRALLHHVLLLGFIALIGWAARTAAHVFVVAYSRRFKIEADDNLIARKHITQVKILERTATIFIVILTLAAALMTFPAVRQYGVTLLASAGAAGIIAGFALQPLLTNLIAGVQIAITQPIRIDDAVIVENEWGNVEEIGSTYVVVRLWDWRRIVLPLTYFIQQPFQNWTRETSRLIGTAFLYVDYDAPIDRMRAKLAEIAKASPLWDGDVVNLAVTDVTEQTLQVRCLVSARNAAQAFDLRCEVREKMIAFLKAEHPEALPRTRFSFSEAPGAEGEAAPRLA